MKPHTEVINKPAIAGGGRDPDAITSRDSKEATNGVVYTSQWLQANWGTPNRVGHPSGNAGEVWTYNLDRIWAGPIPFLIVPVPLVLPVARAKVSFTLHDGEVVSANTTRPWIVGWVAGFMPNPEGGGKFGAGPWNQEAQSDARKNQWLKAAREPDSGSSTNCFTSVQNASGISFSLAAP